MWRASARLISPALFDLRAAPRTLFTCCDVCQSCPQSLHGRTRRSEPRMGPKWRLPKRAFGSTQETAVTPVEQEQAKILATAAQKMEVYQKAVENTAKDCSVQEQKANAKVMKELTPLSEAWNSYQNLRKAIIESRSHLTDPDPVIREMLATEIESLTAELDNLIANILPQLLLPALPAAPLPTVMTLTAGIGGGESARFVEEVSRMYTRHAEKKGWKVEVLNTVEGAIAKGSGGNGFREMTIKFSPSSWVEEGTECFGELMWEGGVHRVQRVPSGSTVDKLQSSTINLSVSPIYPDTPDEPLFDPKDVKEEVMRAGGAGGQHVNKTESAVRLTHVPTGIIVSMQDSRSQHQNRDWAWDVMRARLSDRKRAEEQEAKAQNRLNSIQNSSRADKVRTYNFPQDRVTDHRIGFSTNGLSEILGGEGFGRVVVALQDDLAERRLAAMLRGEDDVIE